MSCGQFGMPPKAKPQQPKDAEHPPPKDKPRNVEQCYRVNRVTTAISRTMKATTVSKTVQIRLLICEECNLLFPFISAPVNAYQWGKRSAVRGNF